MSYAMRQLSAEQRAGVLLWFTFPGPLKLDSQGCVWQTVQHKTDRDFECVCTKEWYVPWARII